MGGDKFSGYEIGVYLKNYFSERQLFGKVGVNLHKNLHSAHGTFESTDKSIFLLGFVLGYKPFRNLAFTLGYYNPLSEYWYFSNLTQELEQVEYSTYLNYIFKLGLDITF